MNKLMYDEWIKVNVSLHNVLKKLEILEREKNELILKAELEGFNNEIRELMIENINKYELLLIESQRLKNISEDLKKKLEF